MALVQTRAAALRGAGGEMQVVRFEAHKPRPRAAGQAGRAGAGQAARAAPAPPADLKRIRHEVVRLGMSGFDAPRKEEARVALAVSLGAKPPKKEYKNYKELMAQRKDEKTKEKERRELFGKDLMRSSVTPKMKKTSTKGNDVGHLLTVYGKVDKKKVKEREEKTIKKKRKK